MLDTFFTSSRWRPLVRTPTSICRGCLARGAEALGRLPDRREFAGITLPTPLPGGRLVRCPDCKLVFRDPALTAAEYGALYEMADANVWKSDSSALRTDQALVKRYIESRVPDGASVLDVGCYTGEFLKALNPGFEKFGIEKSRQASDHCRRHGIEIVADDLYHMSQHGRTYDVVVAMDVIEHTLDPSAFMATLLGLVADEGMVIVTTGNAPNWVWRLSKGSFWYCSFAEHISFISNEWLQIDARKGNYQLRKLECFAYQSTSFAVRATKLLLVILGSMLGLQPRMAWTAHVSRDHLLAVMVPRRSGPGEGLGRSPVCSPQS